MSAILSPILRIALGGSDPVYLPREKESQRERMHHVALVTAQTRILPSSQSAHVAYEMQF